MSMLLKHWEPGRGSCECQHWVFIWGISGRKEGRKEGWRERRRVEREKGMVEKGEDGWRG